MGQKKDKIDVRLERDDKGWWIAQVQNEHLKGCITQAKTLKTVRKRIREALALVWGDDVRAERAELVEDVRLDSTPC